MALIQEGTLVLSKSYDYANLEKKIPVTDSTIFNVGSISKAITAWGVMKLVENGKLSLDTSVEEYLHRWQFPRSEYNSHKVTIRRLLSHTAGLSLPSYPPDLNRSKFYRHLKNHSPEEPMVRVLSIYNTIQDLFINIQGVGIPLFN